MEATGGRFGKYVLGPEWAAWGGRCGGGAVGGGSVFPATVWEDRGSGFRAKSLGANTVDVLRIVRIDGERWIGWDKS